MTDKTTPKTAEEILKSAFGYTDADLKEWQTEGWDVTLNDALTFAKVYARYIGEQVRQQCAEEATLNFAPLTGSASISKDSILSVNIEKFIK